MLSNTLSPLLDANALLDNLLLKSLFIKRQITNFATDMILASFPLDMMRSLRVKKFLIPKLCLLVTLGHPLMTIASPFNLVCKSQATEIIVPLSIDLDRRVASFGGIEENETMAYESDRFIVWTKVTQYRESSEGSSVSVETFMFDRSNGELTTGFVSTDKPTNGMLGETLHYSCRRNEKVL